MRDDLRARGLLPTEEPYSEMEGFIHVGSGGGETVSQDLLDVTGPDAIVDWVFVELKAADNFEEVVATRSALIQRDGDVISATGEDILSFYNLPHGEYYVQLRHRNHLAAETRFAYRFSATRIPSIDLSWDFMPVRGKNPMTLIDDKIALWSGDLNGDDLTIFQGPNNDIFYMFLKILVDVNNTNNLTNFISAGYTARDFNMDGKVIFQGPGNDRSILLWNTVFNHPENPQNQSNFIVSTAEVVEEEDYLECVNDDTHSFCDHDGDGILNGEDPDDDNDGVADGNDVDPYDKNSDSDGDNLSDFFETGGDGVYHSGTDSDPLSPCDPTQSNTACVGTDEDGDQYFENYPIDHPEYDVNDLNPCEPNGSAAQCECPDEDGDGFVFVCNASNLVSGPRTVSVRVEDWYVQQAGGSYCGPCQDTTVVGCENGVNLLTSTSAKAKGVGQSAFPTIHNFNIPKGTNRMMLVLASFEREHCRASDCLPSNTTGVGTRDDFATNTYVDFNGESVPKLSARFTSSTGSIDYSNKLVEPYPHYFRQTIEPSNGPGGTAFLSRETYPFLLTEVEIQALLGGNNSGYVDIDLPYVIESNENANETILSVVVFENVSPFQR